MEIIYVLAILFTFSCLSGEADGIPCSKGEKLHTPREGHDVCIMCDQGTFMDEESHFSRTCKPCTKIENSEVEVLVSSACNRTHDTEILCTSGFYRRKARNGRQKDRCEKCTECQFPARNCEGYYDTVCCPPDHDAVMSSSGVFVCKERPVVCGPGQFFSSRSEECLPCPDGTFMSAHNHTYHQCLKCEELSGNNDNHAVIIRPCSRTAPTLFGCEEGYFRDPRQESTQTEVHCTLCRNCNHRNSLSRHNIRSRRNIRLPKCGMFQDISQHCKGEEKQGEVIQQVEIQGEEIGKTNATSDGDDLISEQKNDTEKLPTIVCDESNSKTGKNDIEIHILNESKGFDYVWFLHLLFEFFLLFSILMLMLCRENNVVAYHEKNMLRHCCSQPVNTICRFAVMGLIVLCIVFQILVAVVKQYAINSTAAECTLMSLSIIIVVVCIVIFCKYYRETRRPHLQTIFREKNFASETEQQDIFIQREDKCAPQTIQHPTPTLISFADYE